MRHRVWWTQSRTELIQLSFTNNCDCMSTKGGTQQVTLDYRDLCMSSFCGIYAVLSVCCHRRRLHGGDGGDRPHGQKVVGAMPPSRPHRNFVMSVFWNSKMSQFLHVICVWLNPFAIKLNKLANILRTGTMYRLLHSVISVGVYCFAFSLLTS